MPCYSSPLSPTIRPISELPPELISSSPRTLIVLILGVRWSPSLVSANLPAVILTSHFALRQTEIGQLRLFEFAQPSQRFSLELRAVSLPSRSHDTPPSALSRCP